MRLHARLALSFCLGLLAACADGTTRGPATSGRDASSRDAAAQDAQASDGDVARDAGAHADALPSRDATALDATATDGAMTPADGAITDATPADAIEPTDADAGAPEDSGMPSDSGVAHVSVTFDVTVPADTPAGDPVHVAGNFQNWNPADPAYALTPVGGNLHRITLDLRLGQALEFKFVRGDWSRVEKGPNGEEIPNRTLTVTGAGTFPFTVASWADGTPTQSTRTGDVTTHQVPGFLNGRRVWVYLPPGYASSSTHYPVLYMLDGQNVFDAATSFSGEWQVDETLESLIPGGAVEPLIVVAVDNGGAARIDEYTPWVGTYQGVTEGGGGEAHLQAIIQTLKPWVDATYRTRSGPSDTGFAGSSLGGLMAVYDAYTHSDVFGKIAGLSPSIWWDNDHLLDYVTAGTKPPVRLWIDTGTAEGDLATFEALAAALRDDGFVDGQDLSVVEAQGAQHNEAAWAARMPDVLRFLFPAAP